MDGYAIAYIVQLLVGITLWIVGLRWAMKHQRDKEERWAGIRFLMLFLMLLGAGLATTAFLALLNG